MSTYRTAAAIMALVVVIGLSAAGGIGAEKSRTVDLLKLPNPIYEVVAGRWEFISGALVVDDTPTARMSFPYYPPAEYDYIVTFVTTRPGGNIALLVSKGKTPFAWSLNTRGQIARLEDINEHSIISNPCLRKYVIEPWKQYTAQVRVRKTGVTCLINGQVVLKEYKTDYSDLSRNKKWTMEDERLLGLGAQSNFMNIVVEAKVREVAGQGRILQKKPRTRGRRARPRQRRSKTGENEAIEKE